jgi:hypothetical protein
MTESKNTDKARYVNVSFRFWHNHIRAEIIWAKNKTKDYKDLFLYRPQTLNSHNGSLTEYLFRLLGRHKYKPYWFVLKLYSLL